MKYSQNDEQEHILAYFGRTVGRFLDIGAHDGVTFSNTRALYELGWRGVLVEPSPMPFSKLMRLYGNQERAELINAAVSPNGRLFRFWDSSGDCVSTLEESHTRRWGNVHFEPFWVRSVTPGEIYAAFPGAFDFVSLDVESANLEILRQLRKGASLFCIEHDRQFDAIAQLLPDHRLIYQNAENVIYAK